VTHAQVGRRKHCWDQWPQARLAIIGIDWVTQLTVNLENVGRGARRAALQANLFRLHAVQNNADLSEIVI
jgi:hypothetical protein